MEATPEIREWIKDNIDLTIYRDYRDEPLEANQVAEIMERIRRSIKEGSEENPVDMLKGEIYDIMFETYRDYAWDLEDDAAKKLAEEFNLDSDDALDIINSEVAVEYPIQDYLNDKYHVVVKMDTGDANYEFVCNHLEPAWNGKPIEEIADESAILWLAQQNGYTKESFIKYMKMEQDGKLPADEHPFIHSMYQEIENTTTHCNMVVFIGQMSLEELAEAQKNGVTITRNTICGLYDHWNGAGGPLDIELQKDIYIPVDQTLSICPDYQDDGHYSVDYTYAPNPKVWQHDIYSVECPILSNEQLKKVSHLYDMANSKESLPDDTLGQMKAYFADSFVHKLKVLGETVYPSVREHGQFAAATEYALSEVNMHFRDIHRDNPYFVGEHELKELLKLSPVKLSKERVQQKLDLIKKNAYMR